MCLISQDTLLVLKCCRLISPPFMSSVVALVSLSNEASARVKLAHPLTQSSASSCWSCTGFQIALRESQGGRKFSIGEGKTTTQILRSSEMCPQPNPNLSGKRRSGRRRGPISSLELDPEVCEDVSQF